jgi:hypothetical protein
MSIDFRGLQERLRERLLAHIHAGELTGLELARATGFQQAHISNFLNRKRGLSLEAMDAILKARDIRLEELMQAQHERRRRIRASASADNDFVTVPIVDEENCLATQVPNCVPRDTLKVASSTVRKFRPAMQTPRPHWERFVAIRLKGDDVRAMSPRLARNTIAVIDRHHNAVSESATGSMYLIRMESGVQIRYLQIAGLLLITRAHDSQVPCEVVGNRSEPETYAAVIGRLCLLQVQL